MILFTSLPEMRPYPTVLESHSRWIHVHHRTIVTVVVVVVVVAVPFGRLFLSLALAHDVGGVSSWVFLFVFF